MKLWICNDCGRRGETENKMVIKFCAACTSMMMEVDGDDGRNKN